MKTKIIIAFLLCSLSTIAQEKTFWKGADISGTTALEARGERLYNAKGEIRECTALMNELGLNAVRLRVWVNPKDGFSGKNDVLEMAKRAKYYGMAIMIDFHYSDWWADPQKQHIPGQWQYFNLWEMKYALAEHTREVLTLLKDNGIDVKWVQIGNETTHGMLWPMGRAEENMEQYAQLSEAGYQAAKSVYPQTTCIVHLDGGSDPARYNFIFDGLKKYGAHWDMIGISVYPYWDVENKITSGAEETLKKTFENINYLYNKYGTDVMIVETGVETSKPAEGKAFMQSLIAEAKANPHCPGIFYWAPELEQNYPLGAFSNHRPTMIMDAFK